MVPEGEPSDIPVPLWVLVGWAAFVRHGQISGPWPGFRNDARPVADFGVYRDRDRCTRCEVGPDLCKDDPVHRIRERLRIPIYQPRVEQRA